MIEAALLVPSRSRCSCTHAIRGSRRLARKQRAQSHGQNRANPNARLEKFGHLLPFAAHPPPVVYGLTVKIRELCY